MRGTHTVRLGSISSTFAATSWLIASRTGIALVPKLSASLLVAFGALASTAVAQQRS